MNHTYKLFIYQLFTVLAVAQVSNPTVLPNGVVNVASYGYAGLPSGDIAQGSMVVVFGTNFGPGTLVQATTYPLPTSLAGTSSKVTVGGVTKDLIMIYTSASQLAAVIPSAVPAGKASITVSYNGKTSVAQTFTMVTASFGVFASNGGGSGPGIIADANSSVFTLNNAAHPGDVAVIWGTGLGSVAGDEAAGALPGNFPGSPVQVFVGGQQAKLGYRGRSGCCAAVDQLVFTVPEVLGCRVPLVVVNNQAISNVVSMPIAPTGSSTCTDTNGPNSAAIQRFSTSGASLGAVTLARTDTYSSYADLGIGSITGSTLNRDESASATFFKFSAGQMNTAQNPFNNGTPGACTVAQFTGPTTTGTPDPNPPVVLDAGTSLSVTGAAGTKKATVLKVPAPARYVGDLFVAAPPANGFLETGVVTVSGTGGTGIGAFQTAITTAPALVWTNMNKDAAMNFSRFTDKSVTWTGGDPNGYVTVSGQSASNGTANAVGAAFACTVKASDGQFAIPSYILEALPVTGTATGLPLGFLSVTTSTAPSAFTATGLDAGYSSATYTLKRPVKYQ